MRRVADLAGCLPPPIGGELSKFHGYFAAGIMKLLYSPANFSS